MALKYFLLNCIYLFLPFHFVSTLNEHSLSYLKLESTTLISPFIEHLLHCMLNARHVVGFYSLNPPSNLTRLIIFMPIFHSGKLRSKVTLLISGRTGILTQHNLTPSDQRAHLFIKVPLCRFPDAILKIALNLINII